MTYQNSQRINGKLLLAVGTNSLTYRLTVVLEIGRHKQNQVGALGSLPVENAPNGCLA